MFTIRKVSKMATECYPSSDFTPAEAFFKILVETAIKRETTTYAELVAESEIRRPDDKGIAGLMATTAGCQLKAVMEQANSFDLDAELEALLRIRL